MAPPRSAFGASPSKGRLLWPGEAGSTVARAWNPLAFARSRWRAWWLARQPRQDSLLLTHRNVYILPTRAGLMLGATLLVLLLASINYQLNLGYLLTFLLAGSAVASMHVGHATLRGLTLTLAPPQPGFCGAPIPLRINLHNPRKRASYGIGLRAHGTDQWSWSDVPAQGSAVVELAFAARQRGWNDTPLLTLETRFPLGTFRIWSLWHPASRLLVYPQPEAHPPPLPADESHSEGSGPVRVTGADEFDGVRGYQRGDPLKRIVWKKAAKTDELVSRDSQQTRRTECWLDFTTCGGADTEHRLARLCAWVLQAEDLGLDYGLRLPGKEIAPAHGELHLRRCLEALALW